MEHGGDKALGPPDKLRRAFFAVPGGPKVAYAEAGSGPDLILIHGALTTLDDMWVGPMAALARHFRVVALDRPGHGESELVRLADGSVWRQAEIIRGLSSELGLVRPLVLGHSFGGAVALAYAMSFPEDTAGAIAISPICYPELRLEHLVFGPRGLPFIGDAVSAALSGSDAALLPLVWRAMFLPQPMPERFAAEFPFELAGRPDRLVAEGENANMMWSDLTRSALAYRNCRIPVHILCGDSDLVVNPMLHGRRAANSIPEAAFTWLPTMGHMLHHFHGEEILAAAMAISRT